MRNYVTSPFLFNLASVVLISAADKVISAGFLCTLQYSDTYLLTYYL